jgi:hypothetical protein
MPTLPSSFHSTSRLAASLGAVILFAGCASTQPPPTEQLAFSTAAVNEARSASAPELAPVEMARAQEKLAQANQAMGAKEYERAFHYAEEAEVDAKLAAGKARTIKAERAVAELRASITALQDEIQRRQ